MFILEPFIITCLFLLILSTFGCKNKNDVPINTNVENEPNETEIKKSQPDTKIAKNIK